MPLSDPALTYFLSVYESGSINVAARRLFVAGSAVSRQIVKLEHEVGATLFERRPTGVVPTDAAHTFAAYARHAVQEAGNVLDEIHERQAADTVITLAAPKGIGHDFLPHIAGNYCGKHPGSRFVLHVTESAEATQMVRDGVTDVAVTFSLAIERGVEIVHSLSAPLRGVVRAGHPLASRTTVGLPGLLRYPIALNVLSTTNRQLVEVVSAANGKPLKPAFVCDNPDAMVRFLTSSDAVSLMGAITVLTDLSRGDVTAITLREKEFRQRSLQVQIQAGRSLPSAVAGFVDHVVAELDRTNI